MKNQNAKLETMRKMNGFTDAEAISKEVPLRTMRRARKANGEPANYKGANDGTNKLVVCDALEDLPEGIKPDIYFCGFPCIIIENANR